MTVVPTGTGFWVPWMPFTLPQSWPFGWWLAVAVEELGDVVVLDPGEVPDDPADRVRAVLGLGDQLLGQPVERTEVQRGRRTLDPPTTDDRLSLLSVLTLAAATFQVLRTSRQHQLRSVLSVNGAGFVRYAYGFPLALAAFVAGERRSQQLLEVRWMFLPMYHPFKWM